MNLSVCTCMYAYLCTCVYICTCVNPCKEDVCEFTTVNPVQYSVVDTCPRRKSGACVLPSHLCPTKHIVTHDARQVRESHHVTTTQKHVHKT